VWPISGIITFDAISGNQVISKGVYTNLTLSNGSSKIAEGNFTVRGIMNITGPNASLKKGCLDMGTDTLWLDTSVATFTGTGDVSGIISRKGIFSVATPYKFGNTNTQFTLAAGGIIPTAISVRVKLGDSLSWKANGMLRQYEIAQTNGSGFATIQLHYLTAELNGNIETRMVIWEDSNGTVLERGRSTINTTNKFVEFANVPLQNYTPVFGSTQTGFARTAQPEVNWVGITSTAWATASNWDPTFVPDSTDDVIIPDASTTPFSPTLPAVARVKTLAIDSNAVLTAAAAGTLTIYAGTTVGLSSWDCNGTFNPNSSTVVFLGTDATYSGTSNFYDVIIGDTAILSNRESSIMRIGNSITNNGIWRVAAFNETTVEYNKNGNQTVLRPNGISLSGYFNLVLSGTGTKTLPDTLNIKGDLTNSGTALMNTVIFSGNMDQQFISTSAISLNTITIRNGNQVILGNDISINDSLNIQNGVLNLNSKSLTLGGILTGLGSISSTPSSSLSFNGSGPIGNLSFTNDLDSVGNFSMNRSSGNVALGSSLTVTGNVVLTNGKLLLGGNELILHGNFTGSGSGNLSGNGTTSALLVSGSGIMDSLFFDQTIPGITNRISRLTYNRNNQTIKLGNVLEVVDSVVPIAGVLASAGNLTLVSTASKTANISNGNCNTCSYITGNVKVQRHIPSLARRWRFLGSPVAGNLVSDWQNEVYITGNGGAANGFDSTLSNFIGIYAYNETVITGNLNTGYTSPANTSQPLGLGKGYRVFIRGDRSDIGRLNGTVASQNAVTIDAVGVPNQGDIVMPVTCTFSSPGSLYNDTNDGWNLVANPYASAYDWDAHFNDGSFQHNIDPTIWIYNPHSNAYVSYNASSQDGDLVDGLIPSGGSFWVKANGASPTLTFKEQFKIGALPMQLFKTDDGESFKITLRYDSINSDATIIKYKQNAEVNFDSFDTRKLAGGITVSTYGSDLVQLALNVRPTTFEVDTIKLNVIGATGNYKLQFTNNAKMAIKENVWLIDTYLATVTDLQTTKEYPFAIASSNPLSSGLNRFYIIVGNNNSLPVKLIQFDAIKRDHKRVSLRWSTAQEINNDKFVLERSMDGKNFESIGEVAGSNFVGKLINYEFIDQKPSRLNYYRLKQQDNDGSFQYSVVRMIVMDDINQQQLSLYPIPAKDVITVSNAERIVTIKVVDSMGNDVLKFNGNNQTETIQLGMLEAGVYILTITDEMGNERSEKFVKR
jgi:hypothetical protein